METLQALMGQLHFSLTMSQMIISFGILVLGAIWARMKVGTLLFIGTLAYWEYATNKTVLFQMAVANTYGIFMTMFIGLFLGFVLVYTLFLPSSK